jgi:hypothetical protein
VDPSISNEKLTQPSIFDTLEIKDLKETLIDILAKYQETLEQDKINAQI